ncbi:MAG: T9SS type A sorting domain-containing protein [Bacteroidota bacterium]
MLHPLQRGRGAFALALLVLLILPTALFAQTTAELDGAGNLVIIDTADKNDDLDVYRSGTDLVITDAAATITSTVFGALGSGTGSVTIPLTSITGGEVQMVLADGSDLLTSGVTGDGFFGKDVIITADVLDVTASAFAQSVTVTASALTLSGAIAAGVDVTLRGGTISVNQPIQAAGAINVLQLGDNTTALELTVSDPSYLDAGTAVNLGTVDDAAMVTVLSPITADVPLSARGGGSVSTVGLAVSTADPLVIEAGEDGNGSDNKLFGPYLTTGGTITITSGTGDDTLHLYVQSIGITPTVDAGDGMDNIHIHGDPNAATDESFIIAANLFEGPGISFDPVGGEILIAKGMDGDDDLTVDFGSGNPVPSGGEVIFQGFDGDDFLTLENGTFTTIDHTFLNASDGSIDIDGDIVSYTGLAPVFDNLGSTNRVFRFGASDDNVLLEDDANANDGVSKISSDGTSETVWFVNPTDLITVRMDGGQDLLRHLPIDAMYTGTFDVRGGGSADAYWLIDQSQTTPHTYVATDAEITRDGMLYTELRNIEAVRIRGGSAADAFQVFPSADVAFEIRGSAPGLAPGDVLDVEFAGITGEVLTLGAPGAGVWSFGSGEQDVTYRQIETLNDLSDLTLTKTVTAFPSPFPGDFVTFEVVVRNNGPDPATNIVIDDTLPDELVYLTGTAAVTAGAIAISVGPPESILWDLATLAGGDSDTLTFQVVAASAFPGTFSNVAAITSKDQGDLATGDNTATADVNIQEAPRLPANRFPQAVAYWTSAIGDVYPLVGTMNYGMYRGIPQNYVPGGIGSFFTEANDGLTIPLFITDLFVSPTSNEVLLCSWGRNGLYRSADGGQSWTQGAFQDMLGNPGGSFNICYAIVEGLDGTLYASADRGRFLRSFDNGMTWQFVGTLPRASADTPWSLATHPKDANRVIAGTFGRGILVSDDKGETWTEPLNNGLPSSAGHIFDMEYAPLSGFGGDPTLLIATGDGIYFTGDNGDNWFPLQAGLPANGTPEVRSIAFDSNGNFYAAVWGFGIYSSDDVENVGANPFGQLQLKGTQITDLIINPVTGDLMAASNDAGIVTATDMSVRVSADEPDAELPTDVTLAQNYPNPFNPVTTIAYALPQSSTVRLVVYDALGRLAQTLFDGTQPAGNHTVTFDATNLPSGVYLYRMETPSQTLTRQLTLMK